MFSRTLCPAVALIVVGLLAVATPAAAQITTGTLTGTIKDAQGGVVPGAIVTMTSEARGTQLPPAVTNTGGEFVFANVPPHIFAVRAATSGFKTMKRRGLTLSAGARAGA